MLPLQAYLAESSVPPKRRKQQRLTTSIKNPNIFNGKQQSRLEKKLIAEARASQSLNVNDDLKILYLDADMCVTVKKSGILSVPGPRRNPSLAGLVHDIIQPTGTDIDRMVVHRLDMDTSGIMVYALTENALKQLHTDFRERIVHKTYEALLAGHLHTSLEFEVDVDLERDPHHPPFMRISQKTNNSIDIHAVHPTFQKFIDQEAKPSQTEVHVLALEYLPSGLPVTRVRLIPKTGRTHQLRVHCASLGFPIIGDDIYGFDGSGDCGVCFTDPDFHKRQEIQRKIHQEGHSLCLHAKQLCLLHPVTRAHLIFEAPTPF
jgi:23S rRNA-/tRNA-specific pseudouridylate synthase